MVAFRRYTLAALSSAIIAVMAAGPAHAAAADTPETFGGSGTARVLHLSLFGKDVTLGSADSTVASTLTATADGAGQLLQKLSSSSVSIKGDNTSAVDPKDSTQKCALPGLPAPLNGLVDASLACSLAKANITAAAPHALGQASVATVSLQANTLLKQITSQIPLDSTLDAVKTNLGPVIDAVSKATNNQVDVNKDLKTVTDLLNALSTQQTLVVKLGQSSSELTTVASNLTSTSSAQGGTIELLPIAALGNTPLATITIGSAKATAIYDRAKGASTASYDPALVTVQLASIAGLPAQTIKVAPGQTQTLFAGTPLESTIIVADGHTETGDNSAKAVADGVSLQLLKGLSLPSGTSSVSTAAAGTPAVDLELAHAEATISGTPAVKAPSVNPPAPAPPAVKALAFTGTSPWLPIGGMVLIGAAVGTRRLRRRITA